MSNELATIANNPDKLNALFGFEGKPRPQIPYLKINGSDDEDGTKAPKGTFVYDNGETVLYSTEVTIRAFVKAYQYRLYDEKDKTKNDMSIIATSFKEEFRSMSGKLACGKMNKKRYLDLGDNVSSLQKYLQEKVKCKLLIFGLVSGKFTDLASKKEFEVADALFYWTAGQSAFMPIDGAITGIGKERRPIPLTPIKLTLKKEKQGAVTYYTPIINVLQDTIPLDVKRDGGFLAEINKFINDNNAVVDAKYAQAIGDKQANQNFAEVGHTIEGSAKVQDPLDDFGQDVPF